MTVRLSSPRPAAVAGAFYPLDAGALGAQVGTLLGQAGAPPAPRRAPPKALIAPHAGYAYSGAVAARAYRLLEPHRESIRRVVLVGPSHRVAFRGVALPSAEAFLTPLGAVAVDRDAAADAASRGLVRIADEPHAWEHALEVQLPFLQTVLDGFAIVPLVVGRASAGEVAEVLDSLWGDRQTVIVTSSDLSHYHEHAQATRIDRETVESVLRFDAQLDHERACGATAINALLTCARARGLSASLLALCNSGDTAGPRDRVVGYCAVAFDEQRAQA